MSPPVAAGFVLAAIIAACLFSLWYATDSHGIELEDRTEALEHQLRNLERALAERPQPYADDPPTAPIPIPTDTDIAPRIHLAGGARTTKRKRHAA